MTSTTTTTSSRSRRIRAVLAGGLVVGVGAAITLAAWNDSEFASSTFTAGSFDMLGSTDGSAFANHTTGPGATLSFTSNFDDLSPSSVTAAPFVLHLSAATTTSATVSVNSAVGSGTAAGNLTYGIVQVASYADCIVGATGSATIVPAGTGLSSVAGANTFTLAESVDNVVVGADTFLCIQVTAGAGLVQGTSATGTWEFRAVSN